jgi:hypothetical protein
MRATRPLQLDPFLAVSRGRIRLLTLPLERGEPIDHRSIVGERLEAVDHQRQRTLKHGERVSCLREFAQLEITAEVGASLDEIRHKVRRLVVSLGEEGQLALQQEQQSEIARQPVEALT